MQSEDNLQAEFWRVVWMKYPQLRHHIWAVPNGGLRDSITAAKMKATGQLAGVWDLHVFYKGKFFIIETKVGRNGLTDKQIVWRDKMIAHGAKSYVYRTLQEGILIIEDILKETE